MIPKAVLRVAEDRSYLGGTLKKFGLYKRQQVYTYEYNEPVTVGLPVLYLYNGNRVKKIEGEESLIILSSLS